MANESDYNPMIEQNVGDVSGDFTKSITIDTSSSETSTGGDVGAIVDLTYNIFEYIPEVLFVSIYGLIMYALVLMISKKIKG